MCFGYNKKVSKWIYFIATQDRRNVATISVPHLILDETEVVIKNYSENEGILEVLENAGVIKQTGQFATVGYVQAPICKLLKRV